MARLGRPRALVSGVAGIGKSRLVAELKAAVRATDTAPSIVQGNYSEPDRKLLYAPPLNALDGLTAGRSHAQIRKISGTGEENKKLSG